MDETNDKQANDNSDDGGKSEAIEIINKANLAAERLEKATAESVAQEAIRRIGGTSEAGSPKVKEKTEAELEMDKQINEIGAATGSDWEKKDA